LENSDDRCNPLPSEQFDLLLKAVELLGDLRTARPRAKN
jgi:hypothetical protein